MFHRIAYNVEKNVKGMKETRNRAIEEPKKKLGKSFQSRVSTVGIRGFHFWNSFCLLKNFFVPVTAISVNLVFSDFHLLLGATVSFRWTQNGKTIEPFFMSRCQWISQWNDILLCWVDVKLTENWIKLHQMSAKIHLKNVDEELLVRKHFFFSFSRSHTQTHLRTFQSYQSTIEIDEWWQLMIIHFR